jgi:hypothetical protein
MLLEPGDYLVELAFDRPCEKGALDRALHAMGFSEIALDEPDSPVSTGALLSSTAAMSMATPTTVVQAQAPSTIAVRAAQQADPSKIVAPEPPKVMFDPGKVMVEAPGIARPTGATTQAVEAAQQAAAKPTSKWDQPLTPIRPVAPEEASPPSPLPAPEPVLEDERVPVVEEQYYPEDGGGPAVTREAYAREAEPTPGTPPPTQQGVDESAEIRQMRLVNMWIRWVEWGSPFATGPQGDVDREALAAARVAGVSLADVEKLGGYRTRFVGRLERPIEPREPPGMRWVLARKLSIDPFAVLDWKLPPYKLKTRAFYEVRLLARDKSAPTKDAVKTLMGRMGFAPMKLSLMKRHVKLPKRPASLSVWVGIGQWLYPDSLVTVEDPFWFEQVKEIVP